MRHTCGGQRTPLWGWFSLPTFMWLLGTQDSCKCLYPENHLAARVTYFCVSSDVQLEMQNDYARSLALHKNLVESVRTGLIFYFTEWFDRPTSNIDSVDPPPPRMHGIL